jgi:hypothetical protein
MTIKEKNLDLGLDVVDGVAGLSLESDSLSGQSFDEDLHPFSSSSFSRGEVGAQEK